MDMEFPRDLGAGFIQICINDVVLYHNNCEDHIGIIEPVLERAKKMNVALSIEKCDFGF